MTIKVSVIMPSYNVVNYIEQSVKSVIAQSIDSLEILCVDAGSTDGTLEILERLAKDNPVIRLINSDKKSYGYQMNVGIKEAQGEYIGIVETDDYVDPDMFETLYKRAKSSEADVVKSVLYDVYETENGKEKEFKTDYIPSRYMMDVVLSPDADPSVHDWDGNIWNGIYRRQFLLDRNIWFQETPGASYQDIAFQQMVLNEADKMAFIHAHFYHYRKVRQGASTWNPKCVRFIYEAYKYLLSDVRLKDNHKKYIYMRMAVAFLYEVRKSLCMEGFEISNLECPEAVEWYISEMKKALQSGIIKFSDFSDVNYKDVVAFMADPMSYVNAWKIQAESMYEFLESLRSRMGNDRLVIFGAGNYGMLLTVFLTCNGVCIDGIVDNQTSKYNTSIYDISIQSASDAIRTMSDAFFLIANKKAGLQIKNQLMELGIAEEKIMVFDGTNEMLVEGLKKTPTLPTRGK